MGGVKGCIAAVGGAVPVVERGIVVVGGIVVATGGVIGVGVCPLDCPNAVGRVEAREVRCEAGTGMGAGCLWEGPGWLWEGPG